MLEKLVVDCLDANPESRPLIMECMRILKPMDERLSMDSLQENEVNSLHTEIHKLKGELNEKKQREVEQKLQNQRTCGVCFEDELDLQDGVECSNKHFYCNDCFSQHIITKSNEDQQSIRAREGKVYCAGKCEGDVMIGGQNCSIEYSFKVIASHGSEEAIENYTRNIARLGEWRGAEEQIRIQQQLLLQQQQNRETDDFINRTTKACPNCGYRMSHARGHGCHHIKPNPGGGCPQCGTHWCYVCEGTFRTCGCPFQGSSFCGTRNGQDCGCLPCESCATGTPCEECDRDGRCPYCPRR